MGYAWGRGHSKDQRENRPQGGNPNPHVTHPVYPSLILFDLEERHLVDAGKIKLHVTHPVCPIPLAY